MNRDFKGVWVPKEIWLRDDLDAIEKVILAEIDSLDNENNCVAGNEYFARFCQCSESKVSKTIKKLKDLQLIEIVSFDGRHRKIRVVKENIQSSTKNKAESYKNKANNIVNNPISNTNNNKNNTNVLLDENSSLGNNFLKSSNTLKTKQNKYSKCVSLIHDFTGNEKLITALVDYLNLLLEIDKSMYTNQFKGKLNKLKQLDTNEDDMVCIVNQSIQYGWKSFYPMKQNTGFNNSGGEFKDNIQSDTRDLPPLEECLSDRSF